MNGVVWLLWLTIAIGICYCSFGNYDTGKYCENNEISQWYETKNVSVSSYLNYVSLGNLPRKGHNPPTKGTKRPSTNKVTEKPEIPKKINPAQHKDPEIRALVQDVDRFRVKHMYMDGWFGDHLNSFTDLTENPKNIRRYLVELDRRMFKGQLLPGTISSTRTFEKWMEGAKTKPKIISMIDGYLEDLQTDIYSQADFKTYMAKVKKDPTKFRDKNLFTTREEYPITEITLQVNSNNNLEVKIKRFTARVKVGMNSDKIYHYDGSGQWVINDDSVSEMSFVDVAVKEKAILQTSFTEAELKANEKATLTFWQELFGVKNIDEVRFTGALNERAKRFKELVEKFEKEWEKVILPPEDGPRKQAELIENTPGACAARGGAGRKKRAGSRCVFYIDSEGEVESIYPEEFEEVFKSVPEEGQGKMVGLLKRNGDKYIVNDDKNWLAANRRLNQLLHHDEMNIHAEIVETTGRIQDWQRWKIPVPKKPSQIVTAISEAVSSRMTNVKLSASKVVHNLATNPHVDRLAMAQKPYGNLMMAKGIINGIIHNDSTAIAVIGSRLGYDIVTEAGTKVGTKFFSEATKVGKRARILGKVAGPIGALADIGLGAWSLSKSVKRLNNASNTYDRDDAIADVVGESIDVAVGVATLVLSVVFPPAAPLIFAAALVINLLNQMATSLFKAGNEVARINSEITLSGAEKEHVFASRFLDIFGIREKDYIDYLVEEKQANELGVKIYLEFLRNTTQFMGVVFPSRSLAMDGGCTLIHSKYQWSLSRTPVYREVARWTGCSWNTPCTEDGRSCVDDSTWDSKYKCICDATKEFTNFGFHHIDSDVDFSMKREVFWERSVPGDVSGAEFKCKPSYLKYTDHRTQEHQSRNEYHCYHAIGLYLPEKERKKDQSFLVNLEYGMDSFVTDQNSDETPYTFWLGEAGHKSFSGGKNRNEFILNGECSVDLLSGNLYGGPEALDSLIVGPSCAKGKVVEFVNPEKFGGNKLKVYLRNKLNLDMERVENIIGRPMEAEKVQVVCNTRKLFLNGGANSRNPDVIKVDSLLCPVDLVTVLGNFTDFTSHALDGEITVYVGQDREDSSINVVRPRKTGYNNPKTNIIFMESAADIDIQQSMSAFSMSESWVKIWNSSSRARAPIRIIYKDEYTLRQNEQQQIYFNESTYYAPNTFSVLLIPGNVRSENNDLVYFFHNLQKNAASVKNHVTRVGNQNIQNLFNISGDYWNVRGGGKDDTFLLNADISRVLIDGNGGDDTLVVQRRQGSLLDLNGNDKVKNIETVVKADKIGSLLEVSTGCDTKAVVTKGDDLKYPDAVIISKCTGPRELQIDAGGWTSVVVDGDLTGENEIVRVVAHKTVSTPVKFRLNAGYVQTPKMFVQIELGPEPESHTLYLRELSGNRDEKWLRVGMAGGGVESVDLILRINDDDGFYLSTPQIQMFPISETGYPSQLVFKRHDLQPVAVHLIRKNSRASVTTIVGFHQLENLFQIQSPDLTVEGGFVKDTFIGGSLVLAKTTLKPNENSENTLVIDYDQGKNFEKGKPFHVNLQDGKMGWKDEGSGFDGKIIGGYIQHVIGRPDQFDVITTGCNVKSVAGRGGVDKDHSDLILIKDNDNCGKEENEMEVHLGKYTKVENSAKKRSFKYFVDLGEPLANNPFTITPTGTNQHKIVFQDGQQYSKFTFINFDKQKEKLVFHVGNQSVIEFSMWRADEQSNYTNPKFFVNSNDNLIRDVRVDYGGSVVATTLLDADCANNFKRSSKGLPVDINNFLINITTTKRDHINCVTVIKAEKNSRSNNFWLYGISSSNQLTVQGVENYEQINSLHLDQDFLGNQSIIANLSNYQNGYLSIPGHVEVKVIFVDKFVGRSSLISYDTVIPSCYTKQVSGVDLVNIKIDLLTDCEYNLIIGMEPTTQVKFEWNSDLGSERNNLSEFWSSTFHYRFTEPMSFELGQSYPGLLDGTEHILYLPFNWDEMETLTFVEEENKLYYTIDSEKYSVAMISEPGDEDQFYPQPTMVTQDGLRLLVGRDTSLLISGQLIGSNSTGQELLEKYQDFANMLGVTMVIQTDAGLLHVGHDGVNLNDRNVVQNVAYSDSYLGGGGALHTIYEVVTLDKNVYISTGLNDEIFEKSSGNREGPYSAMQTLDLTDIVSPIRYQTMKKYTPTINQVGDDLVITMEGHLDKYPGQVVIYGGVSENVRDKLQVLLSHAMMQIIRMESASGNNWQLVPIPVRLERETVYSLAAEDLEYDHHISVLDHLYGPEYHFRFNYSTHGNDLHLSDVEEFRDHRYDQRHIEMTTVIITDFYKKLTMDQVNSTEGNGNITQEYAPAEIVNVTLDLPGLKIKLDGTNVFLLSDENEMATPAFLSPTIVNLSLNSSSNFTPATVFQKFSSLNATKYQSSVLLSLKEISEWDKVLHQVEQEILEDLPFVRRIY